MKSSSSCSSDSFSGFNNYTTRRAIIMGWHSSGVTRTRIRVFRVNVSEFFDQGKGNLVGVSGEFD